MLPRRRLGPLGLPWFLVYLALQAFAVVGVTPGVWPDSESYEHLNLLGAARRLPTVPLFYKIFPTDSLRVAAQVLLAAIAWWALAGVAAKLVRDRRLALGLRIVLLLIGLAEPVLNWNSVILSESVSLSLTALLIAALLSFSLRLDTPGAVLLIAALIPWTFARQPQVLIATLLAVVVIVVALAGPPARRGLLLATGLAALVVAVGGLLEVHRNQAISRTNVGSVIQIRILPNRGWTIWFEQHGMPYSRSIAKYAGQPFRYRNENQSYFRWIDRDGTSTYLKFMLTHPRYTFVKPLAFFPGEQPSLTFRATGVFSTLEPDPTPSLLSPVVDYGRHRNVLPSVVDRLLFDQGEIGDVLALLLASIALAAYASRRGGVDRRLLVPGLVVIFAIPQAYVIWLAGGEAVGELDRLSIVTATSLRVGLWLCLFVALDAALAARRRPATAP